MTLDRKYPVYLQIVVGARFWSHTSPANTTTMGNVVSARHFSLPMWDKCAANWLASARKYTRTNAPPHLVIIIQYTYLQIPIPPKSCQKKETSDLLSMTSPIHAFGPFRAAIVTQLFFVRSSGLFWRLLSGRMTDWLDLTVVVSPLFLSIHNWKEVIILQDNLITP